MDSIGIYCLGNPHTSGSDTDCRQNEIRWIGLYGTFRVDWQTPSVDEMKWRHLLYNTRRADSAPHWIPHLVIRSRLWGHSTHRVRVFYSISSIRVHMVLTT